MYDELRALVPAQADRMVFVTGGAFTERAHDFLERVSNARLTKPFEVESLLSLVRERIE